MISIQLQQIIFFVYLAYLDITMTKINLRMSHLLRPTKSMDSIIDDHEINPLARFFLKTFGLGLGGWLGFFWTSGILTLALFLTNSSEFLIGVLFGLYGVIYMLHFHAFVFCFKEQRKLGYKWKFANWGLAIEIPDIDMPLEEIGDMPAKFIPLSCVEGGCYAKKPKLSGARIMPRSGGKVFRRGGKARKR
jgi:hypothetical protein